MRVIELLKEAEEIEDKLRVEYAKLLAPCRAFVKATSNLYFQHVTSIVSVEPTGDDLLVRGEVGYDDYEVYIPLDYLMDNSLLDKYVEKCSEEIQRERELKLELKAKYE